MKITNSEITFSWAKINQGLTYEEALQLFADKYLKRVDEARSYQGSM